MKACTRGPSRRQLGAFFPATGGQQMRVSLVSQQKVWGNVRLADGSFDFQHSCPGLRECFRQIQVGEELSDLVARDVDPDIVPLCVAKQV